jgi:hypothetical protein
VGYTTLSGYSIVANGGASQTGTATQHPQGWADIRDSSGAGVQIGQEQFAAYGNKSLELLDGGTDARIGILARENNSTSTAIPRHAAKRYGAGANRTAPFDAVQNGIMEVVARGMASCIPALRRIAGATVTLRKYTHTPQLS